MNHSSFTRLSRSRDALKAIRPKGWLVMSLRTFKGGGWFCALKWPEESHESHWHSCIAKGGTEELAELHAIIQAIAYERQRAVATWP
jgi:hypothetical protein